MDKDIYNSSNIEERRKFFGIDAAAVKAQEFSLKNKDEVMKFSDLIMNYVEEETHLPFHWIDLPRWFDKCMSMSETGGRLFSAILDLKITFAFVFIDFYRTIPGYKAMNDKESQNILTDPNLFKEKMDLLHSNIDMAIRFRTFYDKLMGVLVLLFCPEKYKKFGSSGSRKSDFKKLLSGRIDSDFLDSQFAIISSLDDHFRTAEIHQTGRMRKWVLGGRDCFVDNALDLGGYFNNILALADWLDALIDENPETKWILDK